MMNLNAELDEIIHQPQRLKIMAALNALPPSTGLEFVRLKALTGATDGNLGSHIEQLARVGYVEIEKSFIGKKPQTKVKPTADGRLAFSRYVAMLRELIAVADQNGKTRPADPPAARMRPAREKGSRQGR